MSLSSVDGSVSNYPVLAAVARVNFVSVRRYSMDYISLLSIRLLSLRDHRHPQTFDAVVECSHFCAFRLLKVVYPPSPHQMLSSLAIQLKREDRVHSADRRAQTSLKLVITWTTDEPAIEGSSPHRTRQTLGKCLALFLDVHPTIKN